MKRKFTNKLVDYTFNVILYVFNFKINSYQCTRRNLYYCDSYFNAGTYINPIWIKAFTNTNHTIISSIFSSIKQANIKIKEYNKYTGENKKRMFASMMGTQKFNQLIMKLASQGKELKIK